MEHYPHSPAMSSWFDTYNTFMAWCLVKHRDKFTLLYVNYSWEYCHWLRYF